MSNGTSATNGLTEDYRLVLPQSRIPTAWYNILADMPVPMPAVLHPGTQQPIGPADLSVLFPMELIMQEVSRSATSRSRTRCATSTGCGGPRR